MNDAINAVEAVALNWSEYEREGEPDSWDAQTVFGTYYSVDCHAFGYSALHDSEEFCIHQSPEEAKAACQADYTARIARALRPEPSAADALSPATSHQDVAVVVAELTERLRHYANRAMPHFPNDLCSQAADLLEAQAKALSEAEALINAARDSAVDARMNAFKWMERHDRIAAGKDGGPFPKPADLPEAIARALAAEARLADKEAELSIARQINHDLTDGITGTLQKDKIERLESRLAEALRVIEPLINAKALVDVRTVVAGWNGEGRDEPYKERHPYRLSATLPTCCGAVYELDDALTAARAFTNAAKETKENDNG